MGQVSPPRYYYTIEKLIKLLLMVVYRLLINSNIFQQISRQTLTLWDILNVAFFCMECYDLKQNISYYYVFLSWSNALSQLLQNEHWIGVKVEIWCRQKSLFYCIIQSTVVELLCNTCLPNLLAASMNLCPEKQN